jgi:hypothetical protein
MMLKNYAGEPVFTAETVEKPQKGNLQTSKCLILLCVNFTKMRNLNFFDSLAMKHTFHVYKKFCDIVFLI